MDFLSLASKWIQTMGGTSKRYEGWRTVELDPYFPGAFPARLSRDGNVLAKSLSLYQEPCPSLWVLMTFCFLCSW